MFQKKLTFDLGKFIARKSDNVKSVTSVLKELRIYMNTSTKSCNNAAEHVKYILDVR